MNMITVGEITKPQGIKGALKVRPLTDDPKRFDKLKLVYIGGKAYPVETVSYGGGFVVLTLQGISDRERAELLRGKMVEIDRVHAVDPGDGYLIADIVGCKLTDEKGKQIGDITAVDQFGAADVITGQALDKVFRFPFLSRIVHKIDIDNKIFAVIKKLWLEVCVFDD